jgi:hypothetical protein
MSSVRPPLRLIGGSAIGTSCGLLNRNCAMTLVGRRPRSASARAISSHLDTSELARQSTASSGAHIADRSDMPDDHPASSVGVLYVGLDHPRGVRRLVSAGTDGDRITQQR